MASRLIEKVQQVQDPALGEAQAEVLGRDVLDRVPLVEDHVLVGGQEPHAQPLQREVGEEKRMVADQQVAVFHAAARGLVEAFVPGRAPASHAVVCVRAGVIPHLRPLQLGQRGERSVARVVGPVLDRVQ